jgi:hypothetical protein
MGVAVRAEGSSWSLLSSLELSETGRELGVMRVKASF